MAKKTLSAAELKLKKLAVLSKAYTDAQVQANELKIYTKGTANTGYAKTYIISSADTASAAASDAKRMEIDIPKDFLVKSGKLLTVENGTGTFDGKLAVTKENGAAVTAYEAPATITTVGQWMDFVVNTNADGDSQTETDSHISINLDTFIDTYTGGNGIDISNKVVSIDLTSNAGLELVGSTDGAKQVGIKIKSTGGVQTDSDGVSLKVKNAGGIETDANGVGVKLDSSNANGLELTASGLKLNEASTTGNGALNIQLLSDAEMGSWFGYASDSTMVTTTLPAVSSDSITDE